MKKSVLIIIMALITCPQLFAGYTGRFSIPYVKTHGEPSIFHYYIPPNIDFVNGDADCFAVFPGSNLTVNTMLDAFNSTFEGRHVLFGIGNPGGEDLSDEAYRYISKNHRTCDLITAGAGNGCNDARNCLLSCNSRTVGSILIDPEIDSIDEDKFDKVAGKRYAFVFSDKYKRTKEVDDIINRIQVSGGKTKVFESHGTSTFSSTTSSFDSPAFEQEILDAYSFIKNVSAVNDISEKIIDLPNALKYRSAGTIKAKVHSISGEEVLNISEFGSLIIDKTKFSSGVYFLTVIDSGQTYRSKFIVER